MQLGEHECTPDEKQAYWLSQPHLVQFLTKISQIRFNITRSHRFLPGSSCLYWKLGFCRLAHPLNFEHTTSGINEPAEDYPSIRPLLGRKNQRKREEESLVIVR